MKKKYRLLSGWKHENLDSKIEWFLSLPITERYSQITGLGEFLRSARRREKEAYLNARRTFKTIQILKQK
ncbi:hypothetical protein L6386_02110 [bacterium]|nr:hypothetical protein [bacterium]